MADDGPSKYITLVSSDGFEFVVLREAACASPTIAGMLRNQMIEARTGRCSFAEISSIILEKVAEYLSYRLKYKDKLDVPDLDIPVEYCLEMIVAADFLGLDEQMA
ncbi:BTB/POZ protein [Lasiosphaeria ovina]|uniref:Elongin-C n=1 Tax=Lasiosphaeria ovina TaxID=92902 RepID=A0AAE0K7G4_9PEZI|nr:BTB/POZ protein [Lasiosphaeria ovina]